MGMWAAQLSEWAALPMLLAQSKAVLWLTLAAVGCVGMLVCAYLLFGAGPRRSRAFKRAQLALDEGNWELARDLIQQIRDGSTLSETWNTRLQQLDGSCLEEGGNQALASQRFTDALQLYRSAATLLRAEEDSFVERVRQALLDEIRHLFATEGVVQNTQVLIDQLLALQPESSEAFFWRGLCQIREGRHEQAMAALEESHQLGKRQFIDPPLYLGILLARLNRPQDSLRLLAEANRIDANCAFVSLQMGLSLVAGGGDPGMAVRVLQRALGSKGLGLWEANPARAWVEAFPAASSYIRRLSDKYPFVCPLLGSDLVNLQRQGYLAMGQAYYRAANYTEAVNVFARLLDEMPPTLSLVRGLGLAQARLGRYDQAFRHLRAAVELDPNDAVTVGYFALCGACAKPPNPEDRPKNVAWALRQLARFDNVQSSEWAAVCSSIHAEARTLQVPISREDQLRLCNLLAALTAHDSTAAAGYDFLAVSYPDAVADEHAWLYGRVAQREGFQGQRDLDLLARVFRDRAGAQAYYARQKWSLDDVEYTYLERYAASGRTGFPEVLGPDYAERGQALLRAKAQVCENANDTNGALCSIQVFLQLMPTSTQAHDTKARLLYRQHKLESAIRVLQEWERLAPVDPTPVVRRAILEHERGESNACLATIDHALRLTQGEARAKVSFLGARLALQVPKILHANGTSNGAFPHADLPRAVAQLRDCLQLHPNHFEARWLLAALLCMQNDQHGLAALAPSLHHTDVADPRYHFMAAVSQLVARQPAQVLESVVRLGAAPLALEGRYVAGWAYLALGQVDEARLAFQSVASSNSASASHARAQLGRLQFERGDFTAAIQLWSQVDPALRERWQLADPLRQTVFLAGLSALQAGDYEPAAERFREAGKLGLRERRLGSLIALALFKAGQRLLYHDTISETPA